MNHISHQSTQRIDEIDPLLAKHLVDLERIEDPMEHQKELADSYGRAMAQRDLPGREGDIMNERSQVLRNLLLDPHNYDPEW